MRAAAGGDWAKRAKAAGLPGWLQTFETAARWLTGRTWAKGARVVEVMEAAPHLRAVAHAAQGQAGLADPG